MPRDPLILAFDTSAAHCAAALLSGDRVLAQAAEDMAKGQAERLMGLLEEVLQAGGATWQDLSAIGVGIGPGNFTGIRISVAAARGLALSLGIPAVGVSSLEAQATGTAGPVLSSLDAKRGTLYLQVFGAGSDEAPRIATPDSLPALPDGAQPACIGHEAAELAARTGGHVAHPAYPVAEAIARIANTRWATTTTPPAPLYLRPADAAPPRDPAPQIIAR